MDGVGVVVVEECAVATVDAHGTEYESGYFVVEGNHIFAVGADPAPEEHARHIQRTDGRRCLATPGLVDCHHFYQWATHGLAGKGEEVAL